MIYVIGLVLVVIGSGSLAVIVFTIIQMLNWVDRNDK